MADCTPARFREFCSGISILRSPLPIKCTTMRYFSTRKAAVRPTTISGKHFRGAVSYDSPALTSGVWTLLKLPFES